MKKLFQLTVLICLLSAGGCVFWAAVPKNEVISFSLMKEAGGEIAIGQASSNALAPKYRPYSSPNVSLGFCRSGVWMRIPMNQAPGPGPWELEVRAPWMDRVDLYIPRKGGGWLHLATGLQQPGKEPSQRSYVLRIPVGAPKGADLYLRLQSELALNASLHIWREKDFAAHIVSDSYVYGLLYGVMATMFVVNLLVYSATRRTAYIYYVLYLASMIIHQTCLQGQILFMPRWFWPWVPHLSLAISGTLLFFGGAFCRTFLRTKENAPWTDKALAAAQGAAALLFLLGVTGFIWWGTWVIHSVAMAGPVVAIAAGVIALSKGFRPARFYLAAWVILLVGSMGWGAWTLGLLENVSVPQITIFASAALESVLLTLALADWVSNMEQERKVLAHSERLYHQLSITDELSGLYNARFFWRKLASEVSHAQGLGRPLSLVFLDIDDFKKFNDTYGHPEGDKVLSAVGRVLRNNVRPADAPCRYGGEEFALILPGAAEDVASDVAERVRRAVEEIIFRPMATHAVSITVSLGVAQLGPGENPQNLVERVDAALYLSKRNGKNRISVAAA